MRTISYSVFIRCLVLLSSFSVAKKITSESIRLEKLELLALEKNVTGKNYVYDLAKMKDCNKTKIKYLGFIKTKSGKQYKILTSFYVFRAASTCHGTSNIKVYDINNKYVGKYYVGMPEELPEKIIQNKILIWSKSKDCEMRKEFSVNLENGLSENIFIPCSKSGGYQYSFSTE
ncbi:hypothetical protein [Flavobacterium sp.]|uniref:hypothetical protein n=1 Tax=Flavobacterium sp. TaxID=239 RepID=UPI003D6AF423